MKPLKQKEEILIERYILLTVSRQILERDLSAFRQAPIRLKDPYLHLIEFSITTLSKELRHIKSELQKQKMTIHRESVNDSFSEYVIYYQGYTYTMTYLNVHLKHQVQDFIEEVFSQFEHSFAN
ncbi:hypothetical protein [Salisediminibacterium beveridgei]|uniref:Uncharacterized protein n=1 Tax=Salisediminibacterium beveridgei TaxID=632773 RepID=A0A1D7QVL5_9BACI|nr:hypothetical protein [Salisediminibacterium beveridgei]AOM83056.1 hypothetical protein BBEV_1695 [Salisediminibacterium beveridgei]